MPQFSHHTYHEMTLFLQEQASKCSSITRMTQLGKSRQGKPIYAMIMTDTLQQSHQKPQVGLIGSLQGTDIIGKELLLKLIEYLCSAYQQKQDRVIRLLQTTTVHIVPAVDVDGNEKVTAGDCEGKLEPKDDLSMSFYYNLTDIEKSSVPVSSEKVRSLITF